MALESPTRSLDKQEDFPRGMKEEYGRRSADLDLNQAVTKDEGDDYDYQPYKEEPWQEDNNGNGTSMQTETDYTREYSPVRMEMGKRPRSSGSLSPGPKSGSSSPVLRQMSSPRKVQTGLFADGRFDAPGKTPTRRSSTPLRQRSPLPARVRSPLSARNMLSSPVRHTSDSPVRVRSPLPAKNMSASPTNYTSASPTSHLLPSTTNPISPCHVSHKSPSPVKRSSASPVRRKPASPAMHMPGSPRRRVSASPRKFKSPSPERHRSPLPRKEIPSSPGRHRSPTLKRRSPVSRHVSSSPKRRHSPQEVRHKHDRSRSPVGRRGVSPGYGRGYRGRSRSRSPVRNYHRRSPRGRYSPRNRYSPRRRSPPRYRPRWRSPRRRPWSPPPNRNTGLGKPGNNLFIAGFSFDTTEGDLERKFGRFGNVTDVRVVRDKRSGDSRGFGFLTLERDEDADAAIRALDQTEWNGRIVLIEKAKTPTRY